jgi:hypothetical protein
MGEGWGTNKRGKNIKEEVMNKGKKETETKKLRQI